MTETKLRNKLDRFNIHRLGLGDADGELELLVDPVNSGIVRFWRTTQTASTACGMSRSE